MSFKDYARAIIRSLGFDVVRYAEDLQRPFPLLPMVIERLLIADKNFRFVQVGANDGILDDPIRSLVIRHQISGVLVEPLPDLFKALKTNYSGQPDLIFENIAIMRTGSSIILYRVKAEAQVPLHWHGIAGFNEKSLLSQGVPRSVIEKVEVQGISMKQLLAKHGLSELGLLQVDTEGYDLEIIKSTFDSGILPTAINYENCWLSPKLRAECKSLLQSHGYSFVDVGKDTLAVRSDKLELLQI